MCDVPRPYKQYIPGYRQQEEKLLAEIYKKFIGDSLSPEELAQIKTVDDDMLWFDLQTLLHGSAEGEKPVMATAFSYDVIPFEEVERQYLALFEELTEELNR